MYLLTERAYARGCFALLSCMRAWEHDTQDSYVISVTLNVSDVQKNLGSLANNKHNQQPSVSVLQQSKLCHYGSTSSVWINHQVCFRFHFSQAFIPNAQWLRSLYEIQHSSAERLFFRQTSTYARPSIFGSTLKQTSY